MVDGEDVDGTAVVGELPAGAALGRVPATNGGGTADELGADLALCLPAVPGDEAVLAVGAGDGGQGAAGIIVAGVVGDGDSRGRGGEDGEGREDGGELHIVGCVWVTWRSCRVLKVVRARVEAKMRAVVVMVMVVIFASRWERKASVLYISRCGVVVVVLTA